MIKIQLIPNFRNQTYNLDLIEIVVLYFGGTTSIVN